MRKFFCLFFVILLLAIPALAEENMLINGDFSAVNGPVPVGWSKEMWFTDEGVSILTVEEDGYDGNCISVDNVSINDARFAQVVAVEPDTLYRISCMCKVSGVGEEGIGATISIKDTFTYSEALTDTAGEWKPLTLYGRTGEDQNELTVFARVGGYSNEASGRAWFDNFEMTAIDSAPEGVEVKSFTQISSKSGSSFSSVGDENAEPPRSTEMYVLLTVIYMLAILAVVRKHRRSPQQPAGYYRRNFVFMLGLALALRILLAAMIPGYNTDVNCFTGWSNHMASVGPASFYNTGVWCDYPPMYMWMLAPVGALQSLLGLESRSSLHLILLKLWPILFDMLCAWLIWKKAQPKLGSRAALLLSAFFAFNPAVFVDSAAWGQIDSIFTLLVALCALEASEEKYVSSLICFTLAMLIKPQALLFAPLGLFAIVVFHIRRRKNPRNAILGTVAALAILYAAGLISCMQTIDFSAGVLQALAAPVNWLINQYTGTMQGYSRMTINCLNIYYLFDLNWAETAAHPTATAIAWILFALSYVYCMVLCAISPKRRHLPLLGGVLIVLICNFGPMIHERYVFPAILLLILGYIYARDKRILFSVTILSATLFLNEILVLQGGMTAANYGHLQADENWINYIVSAVNAINAMLLCWTAFDICALKRVYPIEACEQESESPVRKELFGKRDYCMHLNRADVLLMAVVTIVYSVVAFTNLGTTKAPQTTWTSGSAGEQIVFDLGESRDFRLAYYGNICNSNFTVESSSDGETWNAPEYAKYNQGEIFRWLWYYPTDADGNAIGGASAGTFYQSGRFVRITAQAPGLKLMEIGFLDHETGEVLPIENVEHIGESTVSSAQLLVDEQDTIPDRPSYYNSTYFDEIYHARTAYEHLHGLNTYEWTHPPLGKVLMMIGIQLFGMTPFGWRFMGALIGVLMLPVMYLLAKQLTKSTKLSFIAMFLMAVDSMHFTQTRIATIDSYAVFWIMVMYLFMIRFFQMPWHSTKDFRKSLIPLGLCGITMGISWATKWVGLYASVGLAVLFFWSLYRRWQEYRCALEWRKDDSTGVCEGTIGIFRTGLIGSIAFCMIFFVLIPVLIYYFSYYWHLQSHGVSSFADMFSLDHIRTVVNLQESILNYHSGLSGDTHYFRSEWYEWPIIWWPMWYYSGSQYVASNVVSSISCMGNPAVWWFGLAALIFVAVRLCNTRRAPKSYAIIIIGFASQFLPWVLVPRSTFIYHYFASVPFIILASVLLLNRIRKRDDRLFKVMTASLLALALLLFIAFYPLESGMPVARSYANYLRWFKWYNF